MAAASGGPEPRLALVITGWDPGEFQAQPGGWPGGEGTGSPDRVQPQGTSTAHAWIGQVDAFAPDAALGMDRPVGFRLEHGMLGLGLRREAARVERLPQRRGGETSFDASGKKQHIEGRIAVHGW